jgi:DNA-binding MarR family transcriptional regulator
MAGKLQKEFREPEPIPIPVEAFLGIVRTADHLMRGADELFKLYKLSITQYNVLRILRTSEGDGLPCKSIAQRMVTRDPDITRLLDRLEARQLITRRRGTTDRRVVTVRITPQGLALLKDLDQPVPAFHQQQLAHVPEEKLKVLIDLLEIVREADPFPHIGGKRIAPDEPCPPEEDGAGQ